MKRRKQLMAAVLLTIATALPSRAQDSPTALLVSVKPHRYAGMFSAPKSERLSAGPATVSPVSLEDASINSGGRRFGALSVVRVKNSDGKRAIKRIEWQVDVYDEQRRSLHDTFYLSHDVSIKPGASKKVDTRLSKSGSAIKTFSRSAQ